MTNANVDLDEVAQFDRLADQWWDSNGPFKPLHDINPLRLGYIDRHAGLSGKSLLDVGCGAGIFAEAAARAGATVTGIDMAEAPLAAARTHSSGGGLDIEYRSGTAESLLGEDRRYDVVTCLEMLEHVPDPAAVVQACHDLVEPGGKVFFSTINRNPKSYLMAILGAEYLLRMVPRGTHDYLKFIRPSELESWARVAGLALHDVTGLHYNPLTGRYWLGGGNVDVNYLAHCSRPAGRTS